MAICVHQYQSDSDNEVFSVTRNRVTAYLRDDLKRWLDKLVEEGRFRSRSHGIEEGVIKIRQLIEGKLLIK